MTDSFKSGIYNDTDGKKPVEGKTYTASGGNEVFTVQNYEQMESEALRIADEVKKENPLGITDEMLAADLIRQEKERSNDEHLKYLQSTDWYVVRKADTGKDIPSDVETKRAAARNAIQDI
tara:strand:+ start:3154 stop:3516 length:363 start_codon:yes stop_codon:yes gene_type:complete